MMHLVWPDRAYLPSYLDALERGWSPDSVRAEAAVEERAAIDADPDAFVRSLVDREARGAPITLLGGVRVPRVPGYRRWMWDGEFCGAIGLRWQPGTSTLPSYVLGHIGYTVVPWKQGRGYATCALGLILDEARAEGLDQVELTTDPDNIASQRVIEANGGALVEEFVKDASYGGTVGLRYVIELG
jgi:predicted acetyltransferase